MPEKSVHFETTLQKEFEKGVCVSSRIGGKTGDVGWLPPRAALASVQQAVDLVLRGSGTGNAASFQNETGAQRSVALMQHAAGA